MTANETIINLAKKPKWYAPLNISPQNAYAIVKAAKNNTLLPRTAETTLKGLGFVRKKYEVWERKQLKDKI